MKELVRDPGWNGVRLAAIVPRHQTRAVRGASRHMTRRRALRIVDEESVASISRIDEPEGQGLVIRRHGRELPEVVYFVVPRWRKPLAWLRTTAAWFADRLRYGSIGRLVGSSLFRRARRLSPRFGMP